MTNADPLPTTVLGRKAVVYVRQSTQTRVQVNLESQRRQYDLVDEARRHGFRSVEVIDDDLGRSASGTVARPGFEKLVAGLCAGEVGRDWHHLLELCGLVDARVIDLDGVYNPCRPNDRLLLGMKGSISEFDLGVLRSRMLDAARSKARRGELRIPVPVSYVWHREIGLGLDPDCRVQEVARGIFQRFREGSARQVHLALRAEQVHFPHPSDGKQMTAFDWTPIRYRNVILVLKNPFYAGAYAYGKSVNRTQIVDGRARKTYGHYRPLRDCEILLKDHHEGYIDWEEFERNQKHLATNAYGRKDGAKSGRGGRALLAGLLACRRCGRRLSVVYTGRYSTPVYRCDRGNTAIGVPRCMMFGGLRVDAAFAHEFIRAVEPMAIEAALLAERRTMERQAEHRRILDLELQQARYEASLAERPLRRLRPRQPADRRDSGEELGDGPTPRPRLRGTSQPDNDERSNAGDAGSDWHHRGPRCGMENTNVTMRCRQQLVQALVNEIIVDIDEAAREIVLIIHWKGGQHSELRLRKSLSR